jgi:alpha-beta hydrolase superfamily lysophospholipase
MTSVPMTESLAELRLPGGGLTDLVTWGDLEGSTHIALLVHGWGLHPKFYAPLAEEIARQAGFVVGIALPSPLSNRGSTRRFYRLVAEALDAFILYGTSLARGRRLSLIGESLGATYIVSRGHRIPRDARLALIAPGLILRSKQLLSRRALDDVPNLLLRDRMDLTWRLEAVSSNTEFITAIESDPATLLTSNRAYVFSAFEATIRAVSLGAAQIHSPVRIWQGEADRLLNPVGARLLRRALKSREKTLVLVPTGEHGLIWDLTNGDLVCREVGTWLSSD